MANYNGIPKPIQLQFAAQKVLPRQKLLTYKLCKAQILHIDGSVSEIKIELPDYGYMREPEEISSGWLSGLVENLSEHHIQIIGYQVSMHTVQNGIEGKGITYDPVILQPEHLITSMQ